MEKMTSSIAHTAGVDISKDHLDVCLHPDGAVKRFANDARGFGALIGWLLPHAPARVVFEAMGAYHRAFERALGGQGLPMVKVNPRPRPALRRSGRQADKNRQG
jgi:transposase